MSENCIKDELEYIFLYTDSMENIFITLKDWFCDTGYSPNNPLNFFKDLNETNIECNHRTKSCNSDCVDERYSISYSHNDSLSSDPSTKIKECIDFVTDFLDLYDKIFCFLEKFKYANDNNIINGPNGLIALFPLHEFKPTDKNLNNLVSCQYSTFDVIEYQKLAMIKKYYTPEFILYSAINPRGLPFKDELPLRADVIARVIRIKKSENDLVNYIYNNNSAHFNYIPSVISQCYSTDNINTINNNNDKNIITCNHDIDDDLDINDEQSPWRSMYIQQQSNLGWNDIPNDFPN